ncbi:hypothetical protein E1J24_11305 [Xanthomonas hortorum pv. pelargonii]|uniref:Uncharacterized protein n=1 Tax=Xanthomonas hortorum pv. pelargonii TaxID=453602 RepID=A0AAW9ZR16_9XANT|nr:hypothetical protein [Xanthomonas hortorum pv. pelargonii]
MAMEALRKTMGASIARPQQPRRRPQLRHLPQMGTQQACNKHLDPQAVQMLAPARPQPVNSQTIQSRYGEDKS